MKFVLMFEAGRLWRPGRQFTEKEIEMRKGICRSFVVLFSVALLTAGCAKQEMVKKDEPVTPATPPAAATPAQPVKETKISQQAVQEAPVAMKEETLSKDAASAQQQSLLETVYFDFDSFVLTATARDVLSKDAEQIKKKISGKIQVEGHCDERGSDEYNLALGEKRARAAMNYLVTLGVAADRLSVISYGKEKPAEKGTGEAAWAKNRRAEFVVK
jgi:peptidoglycan-associated lipoprotein